MLYAIINEQGQVVETEDRKDDPINVKKLKNKLAMLRPVVFNNDPLAPWQEYGEPVDTVFNDHVSRRLPAKDKDVSKLKRERQDEVDRLLMKRWEDGVEFPDNAAKYLQLRPEDQANITAMAMQAMLAKQGRLTWPSNFRWRLKDNTFLPLPSTDAMLELASSAAEAVLHHRAVAWAHKDNIEAKTTAKEVFEYDINVGW